MISHRKEESTTLLPMSNRSFFHGEPNSSQNSKIVCATLDRLALKRARLPLQLLPISSDIDDDSNVNEIKDITELSTVIENAERVCAETHSGHQSVQEIIESKEEENELIEAPTTKPDLESLEDEETIDRMYENTDTDVNLRSLSLDLVESSKREMLSDQHPADRKSPRSNSSSSSDYEKMDLVNEIAEKQRNNETIPWSGQNTENGYCDNQQSESENLMCLANRSVINFAESNHLIVERIDRWLENDSCLSIEENNETVSRKTRYFARNIFYYVPNQLVNRPKAFSNNDSNKGKTARKKKKKWRTKQDRNKLLVGPSYHLESCKYRSSSKSLFQTESKHVTISSPTNFVHVASATNPKLISTENGVTSSLKQIMIMHQEKCATLPLLIDTNKRKYDLCARSDAINDTFERKWNVESESSAKTRSVNVIMYPSTEEHQNKQSLNKGDNDVYMKIKERSAKDTQSQSEKASEMSSETNETNDATISQRIVPQVNASFLWSNRTKILLENKKDSDVRTFRSSFSSLPSDNIYTPARDDHEEHLEDDNDYDDAGELNIDEQCHCEEYDYDDVGPFDMDNIRENIAELNENYDDVMLPNLEKSLSFATNCDASNEHVVPVLRRHRNYNSCRKEENTRTSETENQYLSINDDYSSVDGHEHSCNNSIDREYEEDYDVYDDVGLLANEERVNSLYAGFTPDSFVESLPTNGKEPEWEDLEDSTAPIMQLACSCQKSEACSKEEQHALSRKKSGQRWSRKMKIQRSKGSRRSSKLLTWVAKNSNTYVSVSLGSGSVLLVGNREELEGEWKRGVTSESFHLYGRSQGLVQMRVIDLDEMTDTQEASCYVDEDDDASDDSNYETLYCFHPDDSSAGEETERLSVNATTNSVSAINTANSCDSPTNSTKEDGKDGRTLLEAPTRPMPPPPREASLTQTFGKRIKMLRRTWSITKGSLGRIRKRSTPVDVSEEHRTLESEEIKNNTVEQHQQLTDTYAKYFTFRKPFRKNPTSFSTFYLDESSRPRVTQQASPFRNNNSWTNNEATHDVNEHRWGVQNKIDPSQHDSQGNSADFDPYSALTNQEPLYQFYAATTAIDAYESSSDEYKEMSPTSSSSAIDFVRSGHRTLWCQTPQVISSGLLQRLTTGEKKLQEAKFEILTSEASYLNSLRVLEKEFLSNEELCNNVLTPTERNKLFGDIPTILQDSEHFLFELEILWRNDFMLQDLPYVLLKHAEKCSDIYVSYCSNQVSIDTTLQELRTRKGLKFLPIIGRIESHPACCNLSLHSFLMLPMQRITRLPLLADAVLSKLPTDHADRIIWEQVVSTLTYIVAECNEGARTAAQEAEMENLARKLEYTANIKPILLKGKQLVKSGQLVQLSTKTETDYRLTFGKRFNKTTLYLLLLTDYLLVTKLKSNTRDETYTVIDTCKRNLATLERVSEESPFAGRNAMVLTLLENHTDRQVEYVLTCSSDTERERWIEAVSLPKKGLLGESFYEIWDCPQVVTIYPYSPSQPDELLLQPGDVINVLRKMPDGWYHGEKLFDGEQGWFPGNYTKEIASEHVRAKNLKQRHRLLALTGSILQRRAKHTVGNR